MRDIVRFRAWWPSWATELQTERPDDTQFPHPARLERPGRHAPTIHYGLDTFLLTRACTTFYGNMAGQKQAATEASLLLRPDLYPIIPYPREGNSLSIKSPRVFRFTAYPQHHVSRRELPAVLSKSECHQQLKTAEKLQLGIDPPEGWVIICVVFTEVHRGISEGGRGEGDLRIEGKGNGIPEIARELDVSRNTGRRYLKSLAASGPCLGCRVARSGKDLPAPFTSSMSSMSSRRGRLAEK